MKNIINLISSTWLRDFSNIKENIISTIHPRYNGAGDLAYVFGRSGDTAYVTGDWNNDGKAEIGVVRNSNTWYLDASENGAYGAGDITYYNFGLTGDTAYVTGDWNNNGITEIGVVRNANTWYLDASGNGVYDTGDLAYAYGQSGDMYVTGRWN